MDQLEMAPSWAQPEYPLSHRISPTGPLTFGLLQIVHRISDRVSVWQIRHPSPAPATPSVVAAHPASFDLDLETSTPLPTGHAFLQNPRVSRSPRATALPRP